jgi:hypothetical protein
MCTVLARVPDMLGRCVAVQINAEAVPLRHGTVVRVNVRKIVGLLALALLIFFVVTQPGSAAQSVQNIGGILSDAANSLVTFFTELV